MLLLLMMMMLMMMLMMLLLMVMMTMKTLMMTVGDKLITPPCSLPSHLFYTSHVPFTNPCASSLVNSLSLLLLVLHWCVFFPTCQVRVVRFYVSCLPLLLPSAPAFRSSCLPLLLPSASPASSSSSSSSSSSNCDPRRAVFSVGPQPRPSMLSVPCRTSTTTIHAQRSLPDLNHDHPRPVFPAGPQPRPSAPSVPCRTSTTTIPAQCSLPDLNREYPRQVFPAGPQPRLPDVRKDVR